MSLTRPWKALTPLRSLPSLPPIRNFSSTGSNFQKLKEIDWETIYFSGVLGCTLFGAISYINQCKESPNELYVVTLLSCMVGLFWPILVPCVIISETRTYINKNEILAKTRE